METFFGSKRNIFTPIRNIADENNIHINRNTFTIGLYSHPFFNDSTNPKPPTIKKIPPRNERRRYAHLVVFNNLLFGLIEYDMV
jgi:hypothetical protein